MQRRDKGFSLLEVLVAFAIMGMALTLIYRVMGGSARHVGAIDAQERAVLLAASLLEAQRSVPPRGLDSRAQADGYAWQIESRPYPTPLNSSPNAARLHEVRVTVAWSDGDAPRSYTLTSLRPEFVPPAQVRR
ncbi:MAG: type II secretion system protein [Ottowia sp.]|nr:type II secretion system protein [Ottowia sp.]